MRHILRAAALVAPALAAAACASAPSHDASPDTTPAVTEIRRLARELTEAARREDFRATERLAGALDAEAAALALAAEGGPAPAPAFRVIEAKWGMGTRWRDVTAKARELATERGLEAAVSYRVWGDPAPRWKKTLVVVYWDRGAVRTAVVAEDRSLSIP